MNAHTLPSIPSRLSDKRRENIRRLLNPRHLVLMGGRQVEYMLLNFQVHTFGGEIYIVNERREQIRGIKCYRSLADLPVVPDAVYLGVNAETTIAAVAELNAMGAGGVICYASGFSELGGIGIERNRRLVEAASRI